MSEIIEPVVLDKTAQAMAAALEGIASGIAQANANRVSSLTDTDLAIGSVIEAVGVPAYVSDVTQYSDYGITETGWYVFARVSAKDGSRVTAKTTVEGADGYIATIGAEYVDVAVKFDVAAMSKVATINWGTYIDTFVFKATDLAIRNLDYRVTFYMYDIADFATWQYALTADTTFAENKFYYVKDAGDNYTLAEVTVGEAVPAYYTLENETYTQATGNFEEGVTYYTKSGDTYTEASVTAGEAIPAYYNHSHVTFEGMARNITYVCNVPIDCPMTFVLPEIEDETHGCWYEIRFRHMGSYSSTLQVPEGVKVATEHTQAETAGINMVNLHYTAVEGVKLWRFMNTHSTIPTT